MSDERKRERRIARSVTAGVWFLRLLGWTWRIRVSHGDGLRRLRLAKQPFIFALWHGHMLPLLYHHRGQDVAILISEHGDGEVIARIALRLGFRTVRGSTSRGAARALLGLVRELNEGHELAITPDGPRGPAKSIAPGTLIVAQRASAPILPVVAGVTSAWRLRSWDSFVIPKPFARVVVAYGDIVEIDAARTRDALNSADRLREAMAVAEQRAGG
jgi:lysophospholipid acyltransferase (LPLAT)-like uncharacterized protein